MFLSERGEGRSKRQSVVCRTSQRVFTFGLERLSVLPDLEVENAVYNNYIYEMSVNYNM